MASKDIVPSADVLGKRDLLPVDCHGEYIESKMQTKVVTRKPNADSAGSSAKQIYVENLRERHAMQIMQEEMLKNNKLQSITNVMREGELHKLNMKLRRRLIDVNFFLKDCDEKGHVAQKKVLQEKKLHDQLIRDIEKGKKSVIELRAFREEIRQTVEAMSPYEKVIKSVVAVSPIFTSVSDCLNRCDSMLLANHEIQIMQDQKLQEFDEMRKRMVQITDDAQLQLLGLKNELSELERMYTNACNRCQNWERILQDARNKEKDNYVRKERILDGIYMLYYLMVKRSGIVPNQDISRKSVEKILDYLRDEISILNEVVEACHNEKTPPAKAVKSKVISFKKAKKV